MPTPNTPRPRPALGPSPRVALERLWPAGSCTGWHAHGLAQLLYATDGVMVVDTQAGSWVVPPTRALWLRPGLRHQVTMVGAVRMRTAYLDDTQVPGLPTHSGVLHVSALLRELLVAATQLPPQAPLTPRDQLLWNLLVCELRVSPRLPLHLPWPQDADLRQLCSRLAANPADTASAATWATTLGVSERSLHRRFTRATGMNWSQWRTQCRLQHALLRLAQGDKIIDVALDCGYASPSAFAAMFRRQFGVTPSGFFGATPLDHRPTGA